MIFGKTLVLIWLNGTPSRGWRQDSAGKDRPPLGCCTFFVLLLPPISRAGKQAAEVQRLESELSEEQERRMAAEEELKGARASMEREARLQREQDVAKGVIAALRQVRAKSRIIRPRCEVLLQGIW